MVKQAVNILKPGLGIDLVFNLSSMNPVVKPSIIFDCIKNQVIIAQTHRKISPDYKYNTVHISSLISNELSGKVRKGYPCKILEFIKEYKLANNNITQALLLEYSEPQLDMNIRSAFRFEPNLTHNVMGKLVHEGIDYYSGVHFKILNISISGIGLLIPKKIKKIRNPLLNISINSYAKIGLLLKSSENIVTIESEILTIRKNTEYNPMSGFAGFSFNKLSSESEESLNQFIHNAQLHEIRTINKM